MTPLRKKVVISLVACGFIFCIGGVIFNTALLVRNNDLRISDPIFTPAALVVIAIGVLCFMAAIFLGWSNQGARDSEIAPSLEPKSLVLRMPSNRNYNGSVTLKVRNGDNHDFDTTAEVMQILQPGMIGVATILGRKLLKFEPDREQPNLKTRRTTQSVEESKANQP